MRLFYIFFNRFTTKLLIKVIAPIIIFLFSRLFNRNLLEEKCYLSLISTLCPPQAPPLRLSQPKSMEELENSSAEDPLADCCPWLEFTTCQCNCTKFPALGSVLINSGRPDIDSVFEDGSSEDGSEHSDDEQGVKNTKKMM